MMSKDRRKGETPNPEGPQKSPPETADAERFEDAVRRVLAAPKASSGPPLDRPNRS